MTPARPPQRLGKPAMKETSYEESRSQGPQSSRSADPRTALATLGRCPNQNHSRQNPGWSDSPRTWLFEAVLDSNQLPDFDGFRPGAGRQMSSRYLPPPVSKRPSASVPLPRTSAHRAADRLGSLGRSQVLPQQTWFPALGPNVVHPEWLARHKRQRQRRAQDLSATLPCRTINRDHLHQSSGRSPAGAIFTSLGSNWPRIVTRSLWAAMT